MRDVLIHAYEQVDVEEVWLVARDHIPDLIKQIVPFIPPLE